MNCILHPASVYCAKEDNYNSLFKADRLRELAYPMTSLPSASLKLCAGTSRFNCVEHELRSKFTAKWYIAYWSRTFADTSSCVTGKTGEQV
jgi:hypothetical protein